MESDYISFVEIVPKSLRRSCRCPILSLKLGMFPVFCRITAFLFTREKSKPITGLPTGHWTGWRNAALAKTALFRWNFPPICFRRERLPSVIPIWLFAFLILPGTCCGSPTRMQRRKRLLCWEKLTFLEPLRTMCGVSRVLSFTTRRHLEIPGPSLFMIFGMDFRPSSRRHP